METLQLIAVFCLLLFPLGAVFAGTYDALVMRIPNLVSGGLALLFFPLYALPFLSWEAVAWHVGIGLAVLIFGLACYARGWLGGGDVKLGAAYAMWFGWPLALHFLFWMAVLGGVLALFLLFWRTPRFAHIPMPGWMPAWVSDRTLGVPYGAPMSLAAAWVFSEQVWLPLSRAV